MDNDLLLTLVEELEVNVAAMFKSVISDLVPKQLLASLSGSLHGQ